MEEGTVHIEAYRRFASALTNIILLDYYNFHSGRNRGTINRVRAAQSERFVDKPNRCKTVLCNIMDMPEDAFNRKMKAVFKRAKDETICCFNDYKGIPCRCTDIHLTEKPSDGQLFII